MKFVCLFLAWACCSVAMSAEPGYWRDANGQAIADTDARKSKDGFAGWLLITPDEDWKEKWEKPSPVAPSFNESKSVERGKKLFVLTFFANPALGNDGEANITCDVKVTRPDGSSAVDQKNAVCFRGRLPGSPESLYMSNSVLGFIGEPKDPAGTWKVDVVLKDNKRTTVVPLTASFQLQ